MARLPQWSRTLKPINVFLTWRLKPTPPKAFGKGLTMSAPAVASRQVRSLTNYAQSMAYRVEVTARAVRDLRRIYQSINAGNSGQAATWFNGLETLVFSLAEKPLRGAVVPENANLRQLFYGNMPYVYRIIYAVDDYRGAVRVLHIRHGARQNLAPAGPQ